MKNINKNKNENDIKYSKIIKSKQLCIDYDFHNKINKIYKI